MDNIKNGYQEYLKEFNKHNNYEENQFIRDFQEYMLSWDGNSNIPKDFTMEDKPKFIAAVGAGVAFKKNYLEFINDETTKKLIKVMCDIKKDYIENKYELWKYVARINKVGLYEHVKTFRFRGNPNLYVNKFFLALFPEFCTSIANDGDLADVSRKLDITYNGIPYIIQQYHIREKIDKYLKEQGLLENLDMFDKMAIAWYMTDKHNNKDNCED